MKQASRDKGMAAAKAAETGEPVQSRYKEGDASWIGVTTNSRGEGGTPVTTVHVAARS
jgi:hypothetical protein